MSGGRTGAGRNENVPHESFGLVAAQYLTLRIHALPKFARNPQGGSRVWDSSSTCPKERQVCGGDRWKHLLQKDLVQGEQKTFPAKRQRHETTTHKNVSKVLQNLPIGPECFIPNASRHFCYVGCLIIVGGGHSEAATRPLSLCGIAHSAPYLAKIVLDSPESAMCAGLPFTPACT